LPTYQYSCTECGHFFEQFQSFSEDSLTVCPECEGQLRKVFNAVGVVFKGSGFYRTDSRPAEKQADGSKAPAEAGASSGTGDTPGSANKPSGSGSTTTAATTGTTKPSATTGSTSGSAA
jgi:putative FmdB family regulatory protein